MTQKALNFVVNGMLNSEEEATTARIAFILANSGESVIDGFTDGFVVGAKVVDLKKVTDFICSANSDKTIDKNSVAVRFVRDGLTMQMSTSFEYNIYRKVGGKDYEYSAKKDKVYTEADTKVTTQVREVTALKEIPGVELEIL